jgi:hypothetical protein
MKKNKMEIAESIEENLPVEESQLMKIIFAAEKKHGQDVHMVVEIVHKTNENDDDICYWVEFENQMIYFNTIEEVEKYLLEDAVATGNGPVVLFDSETGM